MATNDWNTRVKPVTTGHNFGALTVYTIVSVVIAVLLIAAMWFGYYYNPFNNVLGGEEAQPLREQVPLEIMPQLPDTLEEAYDTYTTGEIDRLSSYEFVDEANGIVRIPVEDAQAMMLEQGMFPVRTEGASDGAEDNAD